MAKKLITDIERLFKSVEVTIDSCWVWTGLTDKDGYARPMRVGSHTDNSRAVARPHRLSYESFVGPIPDGFTIDHLCRFRCCVNPNHLEAVTRLENTQRGYRATKLYCVNGHELFGENLGIDPKTKFRFCRVCRRKFVMDHHMRTGGAAQKMYQKKYEENNREKRRIDQANRRASWSDEKRMIEREKLRIYDETRRVRRKPSSPGG